MMRFLIFCILLKAITAVNAQPYHVPEEIRTRYYYQPGDSVIISEKPNSALIKILKGWKYLSPDSTWVEPTEGYDTILALYHYDFKARHGGFFFHTEEVNNAAYRKFVQSVQNPAFTPDTGCWLGPKQYSEPFSRYYYQHPAYNNYPVCGVSYHQAKAYCQWLQDSLNLVLKSKNIPQRIEVDLPSSDEWIHIYYYATSQYAKKNKRSLNTPTYLQFAYPGSQNSVISGPWYSARLALIKTFPVDYFVYTAETHGVMPIGGVYHIMGNVAEWTRSAAQKHLFNEKEHIYTVTGRLAPNVYETHSQSTLDKYVRGEKLNDLRVIKGGSWMDDPYYLQPGALFFQDKNKGQANIGFRPIIRVVKP
ncbi:MAG: hypothetical protein EBV15_03785 [Bacteroidetes bacterium]|jgi:formylglycine-generating enzyme required for sulfatase activity|nr:hypothetical protein [Bacteroidota bacterium]